MIERGFGDRPCIRSSSGTVWTYEDLRDHADQIAGVLITDYGLQPGNRVLLRAANCPHARRRVVCRPESRAAS